MDVIMEKDNHYVMAEIKEKNAEVVQSASNNASGLNTYEQRVSQMDITEQVSGSNIETKT